MSAGLDLATVNRSAFVVKPKQPLLDWLRAVDPTSVNLTLQEVAEDPTIYLVPECDTDEELTEVLRQVCKEIFEEQLAAWYTDESTWPKDRSFEVFRRWFEYRHHSMLVDLGEGPLLKDSE